MGINGLHSYFGPLVSSGLSRAESIFPSILRYASVLTSLQCPLVAFLIRDRIGIRIVAQRVTARPDGRSQPKGFSGHAIACSVYARCCFNTKYAYPGRQ